MPCNLARALTVNTPTTTGARSAVIASKVVQPHVSLPVGSNLWRGPVSIFLRIRVVDPTALLAHAGTTSTGTYTVPFVGTSATNPANTSGFVAGVQYTNTPTTGSAAKVVLRVMHGQPTAVAVPSATTAVPPGPSLLDKKWHSVAVTFAPNGYVAAAGSSGSGTTGFIPSSVTAVLYVDGVAVGSGTTTSASPLGPSDAEAAVLGYSLRLLADGGGLAAGAAGATGAAGAVSAPFGGVAVDEVRVWRAALTAADVAAQHSAHHVALNAPGLAHYWPIAPEPLGLLSDGTAVVDVARPVGAASYPGWLRAHGTTVGAVHSIKEGDEFDCTGTPTATLSPTWAPTRTPLICADSLLQPRLVEAVVADPSTSAATTTLLRVTPPTPEYVVCDGGVVAVDVLVLRVASAAARPSGRDGGYDGSGLASSGSALGAAAAVLTVGRGGQGRWRVAAASGEGGTAADDGGVVFATDNVDGGTGGDTSSVAAAGGDVDVDALAAFLGRDAAGVSADTAAAHRVITVPLTAATAGASADAAVAYRAAAAAQVSTDLPPLGTVTITVPSAGDGGGYIAAVAYRSTTTRGPWSQFTQVYTLPRAAPLRRPYRSAGVAVIAPTPPSRVDAAAAARAAAAAAGVPAAALDVSHVGELPDDGYVRDFIPSTAARRLLAASEATHGAAFREGFRAVEYMTRSRAGALPGTVASDAVATPLSEVETAGALSALSVIVVHYVSTSSQAAADAGATKLRAAASGSAPPTAASGGDGVYVVPAAEAVESLCGRVFFAAPEAATTDQWTWVLLGLLVAVLVGVAGCLLAAICCGWCTWHGRRTERDLCEECGTNATCAACVKRAAKVAGSPRKAPAGAPHSPGGKAAARTPTKAKLGAGAATYRATTPPPRASGGGQPSSPGGRPRAATATGGGRDTLGASLAHTSGSTRSHPQSPHARGSGLAPTASLRDPTSPSGGRGGVRGAVASPSHTTATTRRAPSRSRSRSRSRGRGTRGGTGNAPWYYSGDLHIAEAADDAALARSQDAADTLARVRAAVASGAAVPPAAVPVVEGVAAATYDEASTRAHVRGGVPVVASALVVVLQRVAVAYRDAGAAAGLDAASAARLQREAETAMARAATAAAYVASAGAAAAAVDALAKADTAAHTVGVARSMTDAAAGGAGPGVAPLFVSLGSPGGGRPGWGTPPHTPPSASAYRHAAAAYPVFKGDDDDDGGGRSTRVSAHSSRPNGGSRGGNGRADDAPSASTTPRRRRAASRRSRSGRRSRSRSRSRGGGADDTGVGNVVVVPATPARGTHGADGTADAEGGAAGGGDGAAGHGPAGEGEDKALPPMDSPNSDTPTHTHTPARSRSGHAPRSPSGSRGRAGWPSPLTAASLTSPTTPHLTTFDHDPTVATEPILFTALRAEARASAAADAAAALAVCSPRSGDAARDRVYGAAAGGAPSPSGERRVWRPPSALSLAETQRRLLLDAVATTAGTARAPARSTSQSSHRAAQPAGGSSPWRRRFSAGDGAAAAAPRDEPQAQTRPATAAALAPSYTAAAGLRRGGDSPADGTPARSLWRPKVAAPSAAAADGRATNGDAPHSATRAASSQQPRPKAAATHGSVRASPRLGTVPASPSRAAVRAPQTPRGTSQTVNRAVGKPRGGQQGSATAAAGVTVSPRTSSDDEGRAPTRRRHRRPLMASDDD